jgi:5'-deoxynucleotidase YfbR-like HD superfamily hydrolase
MRLHSVKRWHMIDTTRVQTLAEHSANVAMLAFVVAKTCPRMFFGPAENVAAYAMMHDIGEAFTGDIPTHTKKYITNGQLKALEDNVTPALFKVDVSLDQKKLIKFCDLADGIRFIRLHGVDVTAEHAQAGLEEQMQWKIQESWEEWDRDIADHVRFTTRFYAYEK